MTKRALIIDMVKLVAGTTLVLTIPHFAKEGMVIVAVIVGLIGLYTVYCSTDHVDIDDDDDNEEQEKAPFAPSFY